MCNNCRNELFFYTETIDDILMTYPGWDGGCYTVQCVSFKFEIDII